MKFFKNLPGPLVELVRRYDLAVLHYFVFALGVALYDPFVIAVVETIYNSLLIWLAWSAPLIVHLLWYKIFSRVKQDDKS